MNEQGKRKKKKQETMHIIAWFVLTAGLCILTGLAVLFATMPRWHMQVMFDNKDMDRKQGEALRQVGKAIEDSLNEANDFYEAAKKAVEANQKLPGDALLWKDGPVK